MINYMNTVLPLEQELLPDADDDSDQYLSDKETNIDEYLKKWDLKNNLHEKEVMNNVSNERFKSTRT